MNVKQEVLNQILENSGVIQDSLQENTQTTDIAQTDTILGDLIKENYHISLMYHICEVIPSTTPYGTVFVSERNTDLSETNDFKIIKQEIKTKTNTLKTGFSQEVLQDVQNMFNKSSKNLTARVLKGITSREENQTLLRYMFDNSDTKESLQVQDSNNLESVLLQLSNKVSKSVLEMNQDTYKTLDSFCILDANWAAAVLGSFNFMTEGKEVSLFVGRIGRTDYYVNPFPNTSSEFDESFDYSYEIEDTPIPNYCYVGLIDPNHGESSMFFVPYSYEKDYMLDPDTGEIVLFLRNRYGLIMNPLHKPLKNRSMLHKFTIEGV